MTIADGGSANPGSVMSTATRPWPSSASTALLELAGHLAMSALEVTFDLLEETTAIARPKPRRVKFVQQGVHGGFAGAVALEGDEVGIHDLLGLVDSAHPISGCLIDEKANGFAQPIHPAISAGRC